MPRSRTDISLVLAVFAVVAACTVAASRYGHRAPPSHVCPPPVRKAPVESRRVIIVSVDGLSSDLARAMPHLMRMAADGASTLAALVPAGHTTAISHAALFTGADPSVNGVVCEPDEGVCKGFPMPRRSGFHSPTFRWTPLKVHETLFTAVEGAGFRALAAVQKGKLVGLLRPNGDETGIISVNDAEEVVRTGCDAVTDGRTRLEVLHFKMIDDAGHRRGWLSKSQYRQAGIVDAQLQRIRDCIDAANRVLGAVQTVLIVTSDHGGTPGGGHCGRAFDNDETWLVPWIAVGPGIKRGYAIAPRSGLKPARGGRATPAMLLIDTAPTVLRLLGIPETSIKTLSKDAVPIEGILSPAAQ